MTKRSKSTRKKSTKNKKRGGDWSSLFSNNQYQPDSVYDKYIFKYKTQINDLNIAIKLLQDKIAKIEIAKQSDLNIKVESSKLADLNKQKNDALKSATGSNWFPNFFK